MEANVRVNEGRLRSCCLKDKGEPRFGFGKGEGSVWRVTNAHYGDPVTAKFLKKAEGKCNMTCVRYSDLYTGKFRR